MIEKIDIRGFMIAIALVSALMPLTPFSMPIFHAETFSGTNTDVRTALYHTARPSAEKVLSKG
ncbi:hypothetical protein [Rhizobium sp. BR 362]|uniref:hypothetical protein n=1 Tax=Rhizobium sp. BR 362 TaxID=3040670 RepID=UPI002F418B6F